MEEKHENQCVVVGCELDKYAGHDECILHCEKDPSFSSESMQEFINKLIIYQNVDDKKSTVFVENVFFPEISDILNKDFFNKNYRYNFKKCSFLSISPNYYNTYDDCRFFSDMSFILSEQTHPTYKDCFFYAQIFIRPKSVHPIELSTASLPFLNCESTKQIIFFDFYFIIDTFLVGIFAKINRLSYFNCSFQTNYKVFNTIYLDLFNCIFHDKILLSDKALNSISISRCTFKAPVTFENLHSLISLSIQQSSFDSFFEFYEINFSFKPSFINNTFNSLIIFHDIKFKIGLDFKSCDFKSSFDFYNTPIPFNLSAHTKTSRETYRLIKFSYDNIGNSIEANKYFALEMDKAYSELTWTEQPKDKFLLLVNKATSDYGQNWLLPIFWIFIFASAFLFLKSAYCNGYLTSLDTNSFLVFLNELTRGIAPLNTFLKDGMEFISLIFGIIFAVLIYQTIVALKRKTRR